MIKRLNEHPPDLEALAQVVKPDAFRIFLYAYAVKGCLHRLGVTLRH
jgi:hypothetical protein